jgi:hypothetical protein
MLRSLGRLPLRKAYAFGHGLAPDLDDGLKLFVFVSSVQQNTFTGKLTARGFDETSWLSSTPPARRVQKNRHKMKTLAAAMQIALFAAPLDGRRREVSFHSTASDANVTPPSSFLLLRVWANKRYPVL